jgi:hypothetical protein
MSRQQGVPNYLGADGTDLPSRRQAQSTLYPIHHVSRSRQTRMQICMLSANEGAIHGPA